LLSFLRNHKQYGFKDESTIVQAALIQLKKAFDRHSLEQSAKLYAAVYEEELDLQLLANMALKIGFVLV
jgi:hypothetical protein